MMNRKLKKDEQFELGVENFELMFIQAERNLDVYSNGLKYKISRDVYWKIKSDL